MSFVIRALGFLDCCAAVVVFIFQIATLARYHWQPLERVAVGLWGGISFMITGVVFWKAANREKKGLYNRWQVATAIISFLCAIVMTGIMAANIKEINDDWYCLYRFVRKEHCEVEKALDGVMLFAGILAIFINGALSLVSCYCYD